MTQSRTTTYKTILAYYRKQKDEETFKDENVSRYNEYKMPKEESTVVSAYNEKKKRKRNSSLQTVKNR